MRVLFGLALVAAFATTASAQVLYSTSFEQAQGFTTGALAGQNGWSAASAYTVANDNAHSGSQSAKWSGTGGTYAWVDLDTAYTGPGPLKISTWIYIDPATANLERVFGLRIWGTSASASYGGSAGITLASDGTIRAGESYASLWDDSMIRGTVAGVTGRWIEFALRYVPGASSATASVDGQSFSVDIATPRVAIDDIDLFCDWRNVNANTTGWYDDYKVEVVPEPISLVSLGLGAAFLARRRRK